MGNIKKYSKYTMGNIKGTVNVQGKYTMGNIKGYSKCTMGNIKGTVNVQWIILKVQ